MKIEQGKTVVKLSMQELLDAVRLYVDKKEGYWIDELELEVGGYEMVKSEKFDREAVTEENGWICVPEGWDKTECPFTIPNKGKVLFKFKCGVIDETNLEYSHTWVQDGSDSNIVAYKLI